MADLTLEPYAVNQHWKFGAEDGPRECFIAEYLENIALACKEAETHFVGHIKALSVFPDGSYFRISVVNPDIPADREGSVPSRCTDLDLVLNVIMYGLERSVVKRIVAETVADLNGRWRGKVEIETEGGAL